MAEVASHVRVLLGALRFHESRWQQLRRLKDAEWKDLLSRWDVERLLIPLRQLHGQILPEWVRDQIDQDILGNAQRFERIKREYSTLAGAIRNTGAEHVVIKGFAQWPAFVEHPRFRRQSDIDLYCPPESIARARDALCELGYEPEKWKSLGPCDHLATMTRKSNWKWRGDFFDPEMPISVELHFRLWDEETSRLSLGLDQFWLRRREWKLDEFCFSGLHVVDGVGYFALCVLRDLLRGTPSTYNMYELARFLHANAESERFWENWSQLHSARMKLLEATSFRVVAGAFGCRLPGAVEREISRMPSATHAWFEQCGDQQWAAEFRPNKDLVWLHLSLLESSRDKRFVLRKKLFPGRVTPLDAPYIDSKSPIDRSSRTSWLRRRTQHAAYVISRAAYHLGILPPTLWQGLRWWLSTKNIRRGFLPLLAGSKKAESL